MNAVITGATGFVGGHVARHLIDAGYQVHCVVRPQSARSALPPDVPCAHVIEFDAPGSLLSAFQELKPDVVLHLAGLAIPSDDADRIEEILDANVVFGSHVAHAAARSNVRSFVNTATYWVHGTGTADPKPVCLYAAAKLAFCSILNFYCETSNMRAVTLELTDTYGPGDKRGKFLDLVHAHALSQTPLPASPGTQSLSIVHVNDVARAFESCAQMLHDGRELRGTYSVAAEKLLTLREIVECYELATGLKAPVQWGAIDFRERPIMEPYLHDGLPGWRPLVPLLEGLTQTFGG